MGMQVLHQTSINFQWEVRPVTEYDLMIDYDKYILSKKEKSIVNQLHKAGALKTATGFEPTYGPFISFTARDDSHAGDLTGLLYNILCEAREWAEAGRPTEFEPAPVEDAG